MVPAQRKGQRLQGKPQTWAKEVLREAPGPGDTSPRFRVGVLFMSPAIKEDSVCFLTVSFHILRIRLWGHSPNMRGSLVSPHPPGSF